MQYSPSIPEMLVWIGTCGRRRIAPPDRRPPRVFPTGGSEATDADKRSGPAPFTAMRNTLLV